MSIGREDGKGVPDGAGEFSGPSCHLINTFNSNLKYFNFQAKKGYLNCNTVF